jgi:hypothetical protein
VFLLVFAWEKWVAYVELVQNAAKTPHVDRSVVRDSQDDLWSPVESRLDVSVDLLILEATGTEINNFDTGLVYLTEQDILRFQIAVHNVVLSHVV